MTVPSSNTETERIREAYSRRKHGATAVRYSLLEPSHLLRFQELERRILFRLARAFPEGLASKTILEIGCGTGYWLRQWVNWGANPTRITGVDVIPERTALARSLCAPEVTILSCDASRLEIPDHSFDLVMQSTVFSSILENGARGALAREMSRLVKPGGLILWYDFFVNNPRNPDVRRVSKSEIKRLFPGFGLDCERISLAPPLGRMPLFKLPFFYWVASQLKLACTHYLAVLTKPPEVWKKK